MNAHRQWLGVVILSALVPIAGCASDADVVFPPQDAGNEGEAGGRPDAPVDARTADTRQDVSVTSDVTETSDATPDISTSDTSSPDALDDATVDGADVDVPEASDGGDAPGDAVSEDGGPTCEEQCWSGVCDTNGDCKPCIADEECKGGRICGSGVCRLPCGDAGSCGGLSCCTGRCADTTRDPQHCGACGTICLTSQFCGTGASVVCRSSILSNVCHSAKATFLRDGEADDDAGSSMIQAAIALHCTPAPMAIAVNQDVSTAIDTGTGQPFAGGGELLVGVGGDSTQRLVRWLENASVSPIYNDTDDSTYLDFLRRGGGEGGTDAIVKHIDLSTITATHDFFLIEVVKEPGLGTFSLLVYGVGGPGTRAGGWYFANVMLPAITSYTQAWYIYEWTAGGADGGDGGGAFTLVDSGIN